MTAETALELIRDALSDPSQSAADVYETVSDILTLAGYPVRDHDDNEETT